MKSALSLPLPPSDSFVLMAGACHLCRFKKALNVSAAQRAAAAAAKPKPKPPATARPPPSRGNAYPQPPPPTPAWTPQQSNLHKLSSFLAKHNIKVLELFHEWDEDKSGSLDKKELRRAVASLGYYASKEDIAELFNMVDTSGDGLIDFAELKHALNCFSKGQPFSPRQTPTEDPLRPSTPRTKSTASANRLPSSADELVIQPHGTHTHTVIMLHPAGNQAELYCRLYRRFGPLATHCRFIFPRAPLRKSDSHWSAAAREGGLGCWFLPLMQDQQSALADGAFKSEAADRNEVAEAKEQLDVQTKRIHAIFDREAVMLDGDTSRIVLGGTAQGGSMAIHAALSYRSTLGALICLRTRLLDRFTSIDARLAKTPVYVFAGELDAVHPLEKVRESFSKLTSAGFKIEWHVEPGLGHSSESLNEQRYVAYWVARASLGTSKDFGPSVVDTLRRLLVTKKTPQPPPEPRPRSRLNARAKMARALPHTHTQAAKDATEHLLMLQVERVHPLLREPEWRNEKLTPRRNMPLWDNTPLRGLAPPVIKRLTPVMLQAGGIKLSRPHTARVDNGRAATGDTDQILKTEALRPVSARAVTAPAGAQRPRL